MDEFNWNRTDKAAVCVTLPPENLPNRVALTATAIVISDDLSQVLLVDPHPKGTWETWMFPYASLILDIDKIRSDAEDRFGRQPLFLKLNSGATLGALGSALDELVKLYEVEYQQALDDNLNNIMPEVVGDWSGKPFYEHYTLKYSQTSNSYTAYRFSYYRRTATSAVPAVDHVWIGPNVLLSLDVKNGLIEGKSVAEGDPDALRHLLKI